MAQTILQSQLTSTFFKQHIADLKGKGKAVDLFSTNEAISSLPAAVEWVDISSANACGLGLKQSWVIPHDSGILDEIDIKINLAQLTNGGATNGSYSDAIACAIVREMRLTIEGKELARMNKYDLYNSLSFLPLNKQTKAMSSAGIFATAAAKSTAQCAAATKYTIPLHSLFFMQDMNSSLKLGTLNNNLVLEIEWETADKVKASDTGTYPTGMALSSVEVKGRYIHMQDSDKLALMQSSARSHILADYEQRYSTIVLNAATSANLSPNFSEAARYYLIYATKDTETAVNNYFNYQPIKTMILTVDGHVVYNSGSDAALSMLDSEWGRVENSNNTFYLYLLPFQFAKINSDQLGIFGFLNTQGKAQNLALTWSAGLTGNHTVFIDDVGFNEYVTSNGTMTRVSVS